MFEIGENIGFGKEKYRSGKCGFMDFNKFLWVELYKKEINEEMNLKDIRATAVFISITKYTKNEKKVSFNNYHASKHSEQRIGQFAVIYKLHNQAVFFRIKSLALRQ